MGVRITRYLYGLAVLCIGAMAVQPARATLPTPNQPILVVQDSASADPYQNFVPELLTTEGLNGFQIAQLSDLTSTFLASYDVVILPHLTLTASQVTLFQNYVSAGGTLVGFRPDPQLASVFGVASLGTTLLDAWLKIDTTTPYAPSLDSEAMKFHGTADLYSLNGASALATLYNSPTLSTSSPAAAINGYFQGKAILFSFDLTQSIVLMRQGNPAWAGYPNNHDGYNTMRASQMFMDQGSGKFWNDLGDGALSDVPQADIQMRLFSNAITLTNAAKRPLPRLWYFPNQSRAMLLMTGDDHSYPVSNALSEVNNIASFGGLFSYNLWYPFTTVSNTQVNTWLTAGNTMAIHFNDTGEVDSSGAGGSAASWNGMQSVMSTALSSFATTYPSAPYPVTTRNHYLIWVSNDTNGTVDQVAQAKLFQNNGIQLDTSYSSFPKRYGYMTGSGLPMKFLDPVAGSVIPVYEQATQYEDDVQLLTNPYSLEWSQSVAQSHYQQSLSDSSTKYNTVLAMLWHPENWSSYGSYVQSTLQYAQSQSIPISTAGKWLSFWQARTATSLSMPTFTSGTLTFTATGSPAGLTLLLPLASGNSQVVSTFQVDGTSRSFTVAQYQGVMHASVVLAAGTHNISVTYAAAGRILGQITPSTAAVGSTVQVQGGAIAETVTVAADGTYAVGPLPAGTYTVTPASATYTFSPTSRSVPVGTADVTGVNFSATISGETLFTTQTPATTNNSDGSSVNYELGTAFTSDATGQITAVRFWKASSESGTHTGRIWSNTGTLLASVTFANETASGWQQQSLTTPLSIAANTAYVVSVNTGNSFYVDTSGGLSSQVNNGNLHSVVGNNGVYANTGTFPKSSYQGSNYFRDIVFVPGATYNVTGSVSPSSSGFGTTLTLTLNGTAISTASADSSGSYTFTGVPAGSYVVTPAKNGFTFSPTSAPANVTNANVTVATFTATAIPSYTVSGSITPSTNGSGTTVTLTLGGTTVASATADSSGGYLFTGVLAGSYVVTPAKNGFTFSPTSAPANVTNANVTVATFTATAVPTYTVSGSITPSTNGSGTTVALTSSGTTIASATADSSGSYLFTGVPAGNYTVTPTKSGFTFSPTNAPANVSNSNVTVTTFTATLSPVTQSLFPTQTPATTNNSDGSGVNYELGTAFTSDIAGQISAVRFWKASNETGTHTGRIWSSTGTLLASVAFVNETASGWQQQALTSALSIVANTTYVVTVNTGNSFYVATNNGLSSQVNSGNLHSVVGNNGLYGATGTFPTNSFQSTNYFRDIAFSPTSASGPPASVAAIAGTPQTATVSTAFTSALQATVKDASNNPVAGVTVTFTAPVQTGASGTFAGNTNTAITNAGGVATSAVFTANSIAGGPYNVAASVSGVATAANFALTNRAGSAAAITATGGTPQNATIGTAFTTALQATVKDAGNNPVAGVTVTFTAPAQTGASGTFAGGTNTAVTNASGVATSPVFTANSVAGGPYNVAATVSGVATAANFALTNTAGPATTITATGGTPQSAPFNTAFASMLQATVKDASNNPVSGVTVTFTAPAQTGASGTFASGANTALTNASGVATSAVFTANSISGGPYNVAATVSGVGTPANFSLTNTSGTPASIGATSGSSQSTAVGTAFASTLQATVNDSSNNPVSGVTVTFTAPAQTGASGTFAGGLNTAVTNASGVATSAVFTANSIAGGPYNVAASVSGVATAANFALTNTAGAAAAITATGGTPQNATISTAFSNPLQATVKDATNNPVSGVTVTFTAPAQTGASGTFSGGTSTAVTNASGVATSGIFTANSIAGGPYNVAATVSGVATAANFALTNNAGAAAAITATAGTPQTATISTAFTTALQATVKDASNNPISGVTVTFTAPAQTGASGTFAGGVNTAITNASGVATSAIFTANSIAGGPYNVAASVSGVATAANFALTNATGAAASITSTQGTPQNATISTAFTTAFQATVKDAGNNPVSGVTVTFTGPAQTGASGTFAGGANTAITNASGVATAAVFTANSIAGGPYNVAATAPGVATAANFALTNTAGPAATITATGGTPQSAAISTAFATTLKATVKDASNNPVSGVTVTFTAPAQTGASGTFAGGLNTAVTNASGVATAAVFTANSIAGSYTVTASVVGVTGTASFSLTNSSAVPIAIDVTTSTDRGTGATTIASPSFATASANELLLAFISTDDPGSGTNISVSGVAGGGLTWALVQRTNVQRGTSEIWRAFATTALSGVTVTATMSKSVAASITVMSFTGVNTTGTSGSGAIGAIGTGNASAGAPTASLVTTKSNSLVVGVGNDFDNAISRTPGANQIVVHQYLSTTGDTYWVQRVTTLSPAGTAVTINDTAPTTDRYNLSICEIVGQ